MRRSRYAGPGKYRGRKRGSTALKVLIAVLALLLAAGVLFILLMGVEYTDDGVKVTLPWLKKETAQEQQDPDISDLIIVEEPSAVPSPTEEPEALPVQIVAEEVSSAAVTDGSAAALAAQSRANALVVTVKDVEGRLAWQSQSELAQSARNSDGTSLNGDEAFSQAVRSLSGEGGWYLVARVNCFQDLWMCVYSRDMALTTASGSLWYDSNGMPWLSPANEGARSYLTELCLELAELGFDEILLDCAGFPGSGRLANIASGDNYPSGALEAAVSGWLAGLQNALADSGVLLSVRTDAAALAGEGSTGLTASALAGAAGRVWLDGVEDPSTCAGALAQAGMEDAQARLVLISPVPEDTAGAWSGSLASLMD